MVRYAESNIVERTFNLSWVAATAEHVNDDGTVDITGESRTFDMGKQCNPGFSVWHFLTRI